MTKRVYGTWRLHNEDGSTTKINSTASEYMSVTAIVGSNVYELTEDREIPRGSRVSSWEIQLKPGYRFHATPTVLAHYQRREFELYGSLANATFAKSNHEWTDQSDCTIEIRIVEHQSEIVVEEETRTEEIPQPETEYQETDELFVGEERVIQEGRPGEYTILDEVTYTDGNETDRVELERTITIEPLPTIMEVGTQSVVEVVEETRTIPIPYETEYRDAEDLLIGKERVAQEGVNGEITITEEVTYTDGVETNKTEIKRETTIEPTPHIIEVGVREPGPGDIIEENEPVDVPTKVYLNGERLNVYPSNVGIELYYMNSGDWMGRYDTFVKFNVDEGTINPKTNGRSRWKLFLNHDYLDLDPDRPSVVVEESLGSETVKGTFTPNDDGDLEASSFSSSGTWGINVYLISSAPIEDIPVEATEPSLIDGDVVEVPDIEGVEYYNVNTDEVITSIFVVAEDITIGARALEGYELTNPDATWTYEYLEPIMALYPNRSDNTIIFPNITGVQYVNSNTGEDVEDSTVITEDTTFVAIALPGYHLINPEEDTVYTFTYYPEVTATAPGVELNLLVIPTVEGVTYHNKQTGELVTNGEHIDSDVTIEPRVVEGYVLLNPDDEWTLEYIQEITAEAPTFKDETVTIPVSDIVTYYNTREDPPVVVEGTYEIKLHTRAEVEARVEDDNYLLVGQTTWTYVFDGSGLEVIPASEVKEPTIEGNWVTIPGNTKPYRYINQNTGERWGRGDYYIPEDTTIIIEPTRDDVYIVGLEDHKWTFEHTVTNRTIYNYAIELGATLFVNDQELSGISGDENYIDSRHDVHIEVRLDPDGYYKFLEDSPGKVGIQNVPYPMTLNEDRTVASFTYTEANDYSLTVHSPGVEQLPVTLTYEGSNATLEVSKGLWEVEHTLRDGDSVELDRGTTHIFEVIADKGFVFTEPGKATYSIGTYDITVRGTANNDKARIMVEFLPSDIHISMSAEMLKDPVPTDVLGFNNIYLVDKDKLARISRDIYLERANYVINYGDNEGLDYRFDPFIVNEPHRYIINTLQLPINIGDHLVGPEQSIILGYTQLLSTAPMLTVDKITVDLGTISVPNKYNNTLDYNNTDILIHLPYANPVTVDPNYAIGETISIEYIVDVYTGETTVNLRSTLTENNVFYSTETRIGNIVPFITVKDAITIGSPQESKSLIDNNTPVPYIEVIRNRPYQTDSQFNTDVRTTVESLTDITGNIYVHDITLELDTTQSETSLIKSILASGITIK